MSRLKCGAAAVLVIFLVMPGHAGTIALNNAGFDDDPSNATGAWTSVVWETVNDGVGPQSGTTFFNLMQGNNNWLLQATSHIVAEGERYSLSYYVAPRSQVYVDNPGYLVDVTASLYDITANTVIASNTTTRAAMVANWKGASSQDSWLHQTFAYTIPKDDPSIGHTLGVVFTPVNGSSWACQACLDTVSLNTVPEPGTLGLLGCGILGILAYAWRKRR
jgi:hypothetical protein